MCVCVCICASVSANTHAVDITAAAIRYAVNAEMSSYISNIDVDSGRRRMMEKGTSVCVSLRWFVKICTLFVCSVCLFVWFVWFVCLFVVCNLHQ